jgi:HD-like signal output (HDOD) protein
MISDNRNKFAPWAYDLFAFDHSDTTFPSERSMYMYDVHSPSLAQVFNAEQPDLPMPVTKPVASLDEILSKTQLPALPSSALKLMALSNDPNSGPSEYAKPIEADAGLMGQILRFVNSSYFGFSREIASIPQAIQLVGARAIKNFALWSAVFSLVPNPKFGPFDLKSLWQDSLRRAVFARELGRSLKLTNAEDLFAAALLQDMAIPLLLKALPEQYESLIERRTSERVRLSCLEQELFGWDHAQAAAALCRNWRLPEEFSVLIERHPNVDELLDGNPCQRDAACVAIASLLPACKDSAWDEQEEFEHAFDRIVGDRPVELKDMITKVDSSFAEFAPILKLAVPNQTLQGWLNANSDN